MRKPFKTISQRVRRIIAAFRNRNPDRNMALLDADSDAIEDEIEGDESAMAERLTAAAAQTNLNRLHVLQSVRDDEFFYALDGSLQQAVIEAVAPIGGWKNLADWGDARAATHIPALLAHINIAHALSYDEIESLREQLELKEEELRKWKQDSLDTIELLTKERNRYKSEVELTDARIVEKNAAVDRRSCRQELSSMVPWKSFETYEHR
jgi:hypothetical protein